MKIFNIEGNIGCGKTTLLSNISNKYKNIILVKEPIHKWEKHLNLFYKDMNRWSLLLQYQILNDYDHEYNNIKEHNNIKEYTTYIFERSMKTSFDVFAKNLHNNKNITDIEMDSLTQHYESLKKKHNNIFNKSITIYLRTPYEISYKRLIERNNNYEIGVEKEYLYNLEKLMDNAYLNNNIHVIDGNKSKQHIFDEFDKIYKSLM